MRNYVAPLLVNYYAALVAQNITAVQIFQLQVPQESNPAKRYTGDYILLRTESEGWEGNKHTFVTNPIIVMEIVTQHPKSIDASRVEHIDDEARGVILPAPGRYGVEAPAGTQLLNVRIDSINYLDEFDGTLYIHRKITRFFNRLNQL